MRGLPISPRRCAARSRSMPPLAAFAEPAGEAKLAPHRAAIDRLFAHDRVEDILVGARCRRAAEFATKTAAAIRTKSPTALKLALAQMREGAKLPFTGCMSCEFRIVSRVIHGHDFYEGVRAVIVDKDNAPRWRPASLAEVSDAEIARHFAPLGSGEWQPPIWIAQIWIAHDRPARRSQRSDPQPRAGPCRRARDPRGALDRPAGDFPARHGGAVDGQGPVPLGDRLRLHRAARTVSNTSRRRGRPRPCSSR